MEEVRFDQAFMFQYSQRPNTLAARHYPDDVPEEVKTRRLNEIIALQNRLSLKATGPMWAKPWKYWWKVLPSGPGRSVWTY